MKKDKGKSSSVKVSFGKRREGKHSKTRGPKAKAIKKKYKGQG
jgi:hypothetical protein